MEAKQNLINMKKYTCPDCGKIFEEGSVPSECPNCGCPSNQFSVSELASQATNTSDILESSNDYAAEKLGAVLANIVKVIAYVIIVASVIGGIAGCAFEEDGFPLLIIPGGLFLSVPFFAMWAWLRLLVNISYRLTRIDNKIKAE